MKKISEAVAEIVKTKPFIETGIEEGIVNYAALSNYLKSEVEGLVNKEVNVGAIQMSLRRMQLLTEKIKSNRLNLILKNIGDITIRTNLTDFTYENSATLIDSQQSLVEQEKHNKDFFFTFAQGVSESTMILNHSAENKLVKLFKHEKLITKNIGLASITIKLPAENIKIAGLYFHFFKLLAWDNINVCQVISTANEFTIVVENKDAKKTISVLMSLKG